MPLTGPRQDSNQILPDIYDPVHNAIQVEGVVGGGGAPIAVTGASGNPVDVNVLNTLIPEDYDSISLTYWTSGNGNGQIETVQYYEGGLSGTLVATLTLNYNASAQLSSVVRT